MAEEEKFDAIIVGAGPAGCACAYALAREGKSVLLIERANTAGGKNLSGGRIYTYALELLEPGLYKSAPLQRKVVREQMMLLGKNSAVTIDYAAYDCGEEPPQSYTVLKVPFDEWFAAKAEEKGAFFVSGILVEDLIEKDGKIVGVKAGEDEMFADLVIAADGVNSFIAQKAGLFPDISAKAVGIGVKEVIALPKADIEARFNLQGDEGAARVLLGCSDGISGGAFLYTNKDSVSLGIVLNPCQTAQNGKKIREILQELKMHRTMRPLLEGGKTVEYGAHLVPESGWNGIPQRLYRDGLLVVGDAAGFCLNTGTVIRGLDLAIVSGLAAANAFCKARRLAEIGPLYREELEALLLLPTMKIFAGWHKLFEIERLFKQYPLVANDVMKLMFAVDGKVPEKMPKAMLHVIKKHISLANLLADGWKGFKAM